MLAKRHLQKNPYCEKPLPEKKTITKPLLNRTFNHGLPEGPIYPVLTIIKELLRPFES